MGGACCMLPFAFIFDIVYTYPVRTVKGTVKFPHRCYKKIQGHMNHSEYEKQRDKFGGDVIDALKQLYHRYNNQLQGVILDHHHVCLCVI